MPLVAASSVSAVPSRVTPRLYDVVIVVVLSASVVAKLFVFTGLSGLTVTGDWGSNVGDNTATMLTTG